MNKFNTTSTEELSANPQWAYECALEFALLTGATPEVAEKEALAAAAKVEAQNAQKVAA